MITEDGKYFVFDTNLCFIEWSIYIERQFISS